MRRLIRVLGLSAVFVCAGAVFTYAGAAEDLAPALIECRSMADDGDRLACFDDATSDLGLDDAGKTNVAAAPLTQEEIFGRNDLKDFQKEKKKTSKVNNTLASKVIEIAENKRGKYVVILENGQIWRQLSADTDKLRVPKDASGIGVTIKRKALGAHVLFLETGKRSIRVERIK